MPSSGIGISDDVTEIYNRLKNPPKNLHWAKFGFDEGAKNIVVKDKKEKQGTTPLDVETIPSLFPDNECFYLVIDVKISKADGVTQEKIAFIQWVPDNAAVKQKMLMSTSAGDLKGKLQGLHAKIEATEASEVTFEAIKTAILNA